MKANPSVRGKNTAHPTPMRILEHLGEFTSFTRGGEYRFVHSYENTTALSTLL